MSAIRLVLFDVDGVLLDSLIPHLEICEDKKREFGLEISIPSASELKVMARRGVRISPMKCFFMAVGFPPDLAERADRQYQRVFQQKYAPAAFPHVDRMLADLHEGGLRMGIVTSNIWSNIAVALGDSMKYFDPELIYSKESVAEISKSQAITAAMVKARVQPMETLYIGDQLADFEAASAAGAGFLGVSYGWGLSDEDDMCPIARSISDIPRCVLQYGSRLS